MTCSGRFVAIPSFMIGIELVLLARIASGSVTISSRARNTSTLAVSSSTTASTTSWRSASSPRSVVNCTLPQRLVAGVLGELAGADPAVERGRQALLSGFGGTGVDLADDDVEAGAGAHLGDARAHQSAAHDTDALDVTHRTRMVPVRQPAATAPTCLDADGTRVDDVAHGRHRYRPTVPPSCRTASTRGGSPTASTACSGRDGRCDAGPAVHRVGADVLPGDGRPGGPPAVLVQGRRPGLRACARRHGAVLPELRRQRDVPVAGQRAGEPGGRHAVHRLHRRRTGCACRAGRRSPTTPSWWRRIRAPSSSCAWPSTRCSRTARATSTGWRSGAVAVRARRPTARRRWRTGSASRGPATCSRRTTPPGR